MCALQGLQHNGGISVTKQNITAWFLEGGSVAIPKHLLGLMEPLGLNFEDLGKMVYLLYCGTDQVKRNDHYAQEAARTLHAKGLIHWFTDTETVDFSPMFDKISVSLGETPQYLAENRENFTSTELNYAQVLKNIEQKLGYFLTLQEKQMIQEVVQRYNWSYELVQELFMLHYKEHKSESNFRWFCQMAYGAQVQDKASLKAFADNLDTITYKTKEVLRRLGKRNNPSEPQKELYLKWSAQWKFTHEMILQAVEETTGADNPSFNYLDSILKSWMEAGIATPEDLQADKQRQQNMKDNRAQGHTGGSRRKGGLPEYDTKKENLDFLEW